MIYPVHEYVRPAHPGGLPGWNTCEDDRLSTPDDEVYCDRREDDPVHDLAAAARRADLFTAYETSMPLWHKPVLEYVPTA